MAPVHRTNASISDWFIPLFTASFAITLVIYKLGSLLSSANTRKNTIKSSKTSSIILIKDFYQFVEISFFFSFVYVITRTQFVRRSFILLLTDLSTEQPLGNSTLVRNHVTTVWC